MIIITSFLKNITKYLNLGKANIFPMKYGCENCGYQGKLHRHGFYSRNVISRFQVHRISILRVKCPNCNKTYSLLPSFLIPYYQYSFDFIFCCLYYYYVKKYTYTQIIDKCRSLNPDLTFNASNISYSRRRLELVSKITNLFFANYPKYYYNMNNPSLNSLMTKIKLFVDDKGNFNYLYFKKMNYYFFSNLKESN